ncbi:hypothetical protein BGZ76_010538 [Entomortierella beljakovae]|nr:hypothetical protein BGZ76_010538 [Entomortierella beljakovae]
MTRLIIRITAAALVVALTVLNSQVEAAPVGTLGLIPGSQSTPGKLLSRADAVQDTATNAQDTATNALNGVPGSTVVKNTVSKVQDAVAPKLAARDVATMAKELVEKTPVADALKGAESNVGPKLSETTAPLNAVQSTQKRSASESVAGAGDAVNGVKETAKKVTEEAQRTVGGVQRKLPAEPVESAKNTVGNTVENAGPL